jgi:hypothetical protein
MKHNNFHKFISQHNVHPCTKSNCPHDKGHCNDSVIRDKLFSCVLTTTAFTFFHSQHYVVFEVTVAPYVILVKEMSALLTRVCDRDLRITTVLHLESSEG